MSVAGKVEIDFVGRRDGAPGQESINNPRARVFLAEDTSIADVRRNVIRARENPKLTPQLEGVLIGPLLVFPKILDRRRWRWRILSITIDGVGLVRF